MFNVKIKSPLLWNLLLPQTPPINDINISNIGGRVDLKVTFSQQSTLNIKKKEAVWDCQCGKDCQRARFGSPRAICLLSYRLRTYSEKFAQCLYNLWKKSSFLPCSSFKIKWLEKPEYKCLSQIQNKFKAASCNVCLKDINIYRLRTYSEKFAQCLYNLWKKSSFLPCLMSKLYLHFYEICCCHNGPLPFWW
jgi:hypothetical protein